MEDAAKTADTVVTPLTPDSSSECRATGDVNDDTWVYFRAGKTIYWTVLLSSANTQVVNSKDRGNEVVTFKKGLTTDFLSQAGGAYSITATGEIVDDYTSYQITGKQLGSFGSSVLSVALLDRWHPAERPSDDSVGPTEGVSTPLTPCCRAVTHRVEGETPRIDVSIECDGSSCLEASVSASNRSALLGEDLSCGSEATVLRGLAIEWRSLGEGLCEVTLSGRILSQGDEYTIEAKRLAIYSE
ncbi:MAG: hypothetical protein AAF481_12120 [Acidobacteriota bacterium]